MKASILLFGVLAVCLVFNAAHAADVEAEIAKRNKGPDYQRLQLDYNISTIAIGNTGAPSSPGQTLVIVFAVYEGPAVAANLVARNFVTITTMPQIPGQTGQIYNGQYLANIEFIAGQYNGSRLSVSGGASYDVTSTSPISLTFVVNGGTGRFLGVAGTATIRSADPQFITGTASYDLYVPRRLDGSSVNHSE